MGTNSSIIDCKALLIGKNVLLYYKLIQLPVTSEFGCLRGERTTATLLSAFYILTIKPDTCNSHPS